MVRKIAPLLLFLIIPSILTSAPRHSSRVNAKDLIVPILTGDEPLPTLIPFPCYPIGNSHDEVDIIGDTVVIGTTWYENQHSGSCGRMLAISNDGWIHFSWMKGFESDPAGPRHVWYNAYDLVNNILAFPDGIIVDQSARAGFCTLDAAYGGAFIGFHHISSVYPNRTNLAISGGWGIFEPELPAEFEGILYPHIMFDHAANPAMHIVSAEYLPNAGDPLRHLYTSAWYDSLAHTIYFPTPPDSAFRIMSWTMTDAGDVGTSPVSNRVAFAWTYPMDDSVGIPGADLSQWNNDIMVLIDDDGQGFHFEDAFNLTNFFSADSSWLPDTLLANMDTLRAYTDLNVFIDQDDWVHVVFTTRAYFTIGAEGPYSYWNTSAVWHWTEQYPNEFQTIHNAFDDWWPEYEMFNNVYCGAWNVKTQRPQLAQDPNSGYLYCMYQVYDTDTTHLSAFTGQSGWGMPSGEIYMSVSQDGGLSWSIGINVTGTITPNQAPAGQCLSEISPSLAKATADGFAHVQYILDLDAGNAIQTEGAATNNPVVYHRVPLDQIPATPLVPQWPEPGSIPFHVEQAVSVEPPGAGILNHPRIFDLRQNYPNPFNPVTSITFSLDQVSEVSLNVYNLKGEIVANVASGTYGTGEHTVTFDGSALSSGVYFYKLKAGQRTLEKKMLLLK